MPSPAVTDLSAVEQHYRIAKAAFLLDVSPRAVRALVSAGKLRALKITTRRVAIAASEIARYLASINPTR